MREVMRTPQPGSTFLYALAFVAAAFERTTFPTSDPRSNPAEAQERGFQISLPASVLGSRIVVLLKTSAEDHLGA